MFNLKNPFATHYILIISRRYKIPSAIVYQGITLSRHGLAPMRVSECFGYWVWFNIMWGCVSWVWRFIFCIGQWMLFFALVVIKCEQWQNPLTWWLLMMKRWENMGEIQVVIRWEVLVGGWFDVHYQEKEKLMYQVEWQRLKLHTWAAERGPCQLGVEWPNGGLKDTTWIGGGIEVLMRLGDWRVGLLDREAYGNWDLTNLTYLETYFGIGWIKTMICTLSKRVTNKNAGFRSRFQFVWCVGS